VPKTGDNGQQREKEKGGKQGIQGDKKDWAQDGLVVTKKMGKKNRFSRRQAWCLGNHRGGRERVRGTKWKHHGLPAPFPKKPLVNVDGGGGEPATPYRAKIKGVTCRTNTEVHFYWGKAKNGPR